MNYNNETCSIVGMVDGDGADDVDACCRCAGGSTDLHPCRVHRFHPSAVVCAQLCPYFSQWVNGFWCCFMPTPRAKVSGMDDQTRGVVLPTVLECGLACIPDTVWGHSCAVLRRVPGCARPPTYEPGTRRYPLA